MLLVTGAVLCLARSEPASLHSIVPPLAPCCQKFKHECFRMQRKDKDNHVKNCSKLI